MNKSFIATYLSDGGSYVREKNVYEGYYWVDYNNYFSQLKRYPFPTMPKELDGKELIERVDFELQQDFFEASTEPSEPNTQAQPSNGFATIIFS